MTEPGQHEPPVTDPAMCRRVVAGALRVARQQSGLLQAHVAAKLGWSPSKVLRIENGQIGVSVEGLTALLDLYGIHDRAHRNRLEATARLAAQRSQEASHGVLDKIGREYVTLERSATRIRLYASGVVPDLLTTTPYAEAVIAATVPPDTPSDVRRSMVDLCLARQASVIEADAPPQLDVVLDEPTLWRGLATRTAPPDVLDGQVERLQQLAARRTISIRVLPLWHDTSIGLIGSFVVLDLPAAVDGPVAYRLDGFGMPIRAVPDSTEIARYTSAFDDLYVGSLPPSGLGRTIRDILSHPSRTGWPAAHDEAIRVAEAQLLGRTTRET
ncbi:MAG: hypothetical protein QOE61_1218 [Micromonosporaceae bacterium]|nr:hypothetical protein [Micromonosporaceae bacterium]